MCGLLPYFELSHRGPTNQFYIQRVASSLPKSVVDVAISLILYPYLITALLNSDQRSEIR